MRSGKQRERHSRGRDCRRLTYEKHPPVCAPALARAGAAHSGAPGGGGWRPPDLILPLPLDAVLPLWALGGGWGRVSQQLGPQCVRPSGVAKGASGGGTRRGS